MTGAAARMWPMSPGIGSHAILASNEWLPRRRLRNRHLAHDTLVGILHLATRPLDNVTPGIVRSGRRTFAATAALSSSVSALAAAVTCLMPLGPTGAWLGRCKPNHCRADRQHADADAPSECACGGPQRLYNGTYPERRRRKRQHHVTGRLGCSLGAGGGSRFVRSLCRLFDCAKR